MASNLYAFYSASKAGHKHTKGDPDREDENQDTVISRIFNFGASENCYIAGVIDGISGCPFGGAVSKWLKHHLENDSIVDACSNDVFDGFYDYLQELYGCFKSEFADDEDFLASGASYSLAVAFRNHCRVCYVGDSPFFFSSRSPDGAYETSSFNIFRHSNILEDCFGSGGKHNTKTMDFEVDREDVVTMVSDGFLEKYDAEDLSHGFTGPGLNKDLLDQMVSVCTLPRNSDDSSVVALKRVI